MSQKKTKTDLQWEKFGIQNPYFGVLTNKRFYKKRLSNKQKVIFFRSGKNHVKTIFKILKKYFNKKHFENGLDFGCGVGRILAPLSYKCTKIFGADVSMAMLNEAEKNLKDLKISNAAFLLTSELLCTRLRFDFIHSFIVFQHIQPKQGISLLEDLLKKLKPNGIGCIHITIAQKKFAKTIAFFKQKVPFAANLANIFKRRPFFDPVLQMYCYNLIEIKSLFDKNKINTTFMEFTDHGGSIGCIFIFQKP